MHYLPEWILNIIDTENLSCNQCNVFFTRGHLMYIGIQEGSQPPHHDMLCIGMFCQKCKEMTIFELKEMTLLELSMEILEQTTGGNKRTFKSKSKKKKIQMPMLNKSKREKKKLNPKSKISLQEIEDSKNFLANIKNHQEFLVALGMSLEEIGKYNLRRKNE